MKIFTKLFVLSCAASLLSAAEYGVVNFTTCIAESKKGKQEQASFETLKKQYTQELEALDAQLNDISQKLNDSEYMDGLSPEAEAELKNKFDENSQQFGRYQNQFYQVMQQAQMRIYQQVNQDAQTAAEKVAKDKKLYMIINKDTCLYYNPSNDVTQAVIAEMDKRFEDIKKTSNIEAAK